MSNIVPLGVEYRAPSFCEGILPTAVGPQHPTLAGAPGEADAVEEFQDLNRAFAPDADGISIFRRFDHAALPRQSRKWARISPP